MTWFGKKSVPRYQDSEQTSGKRTLAEFMLNLKASLEVFEQSRTLFIPREFGFARIRIFI